MQIRVAAGLYGLFFFFPFYFFFCDTFACLVCFITFVKNGARYLRAVNEQRRRQISDTRCSVRDAISHGAPKTFRRKRARGSEKGRPYGWSRQRRGNPFKGQTRSIFDPDGIGCLRRLSGLLRNWIFVQSLKILTVLRDMECWNYASMYTQTLLS